MIDLSVRGTTSVGETDVDWERAERGGGDMPGAHDFYKVTYIRHLKSKGLSVTMLTKKKEWSFRDKNESFL